MSQLYEKYQLNQRLKDVYNYIEENKLQHHIERRIQNLKNSIIKYRRKYGASQYIYGLYAEAYKLQMKYTDSQVVEYRHKVYSILAGTMAETDDMKRDKLIIEEENMFHSHKILSKSSMSAQLNAQNNKSSAFKPSDNQPKYYLNDNEYKL